jgi:DNA-binding GntR family transcriptional regulator
MLLRDMPKTSARRLRELHGESLADQSRELIRAAIIGGAFRPGERVTIEQVAAELGVSRTPVREALKALEGDGLVRLIPHRGAIVEAVAGEELAHRYNIRAMLEGYAAQLACTAAEDGLAEELEANCEAAAALHVLPAGGEPAARELADLNIAFHQAIRDASGSRTLVRLFGSLQNPRKYTMSFWSDEARRFEALAAHDRIAAAIRAKRPAQARRLMEDHLRSASTVPPPAGERDGAA